MKEWGINFVLLGFLAYVVWNLRQSRRTGRIYLGLLEIDKKWDKKNQFYSGVVVINWVWVGILIFLLYLRLLNQFGVRER